MNCLRSSASLLVLSALLSAACGSNVIYDRGAGGGSGVSVTGGIEPCPTVPQLGAACALYGQKCGSPNCPGQVVCGANGWALDYEINDDCGSTTISASASTTGAGGSECTLVGTWDGVSGIDGSNPSTSASYVFNADGTWIGGQYQQDPASTQFMYGKYTVTSTVFSLTEGVNMGTYCAASVPASYAISFAPDCSSMNLVTKTDGCTGARLYMNASPDGTTFTRRP